MSSQEVRFCETRDGVTVAYSIEGHGPPLAFVNRWGWCGLEYRKHPAAGGLVARLARERTVVTFDRRGIGSSQRDVGEVSQATDMADMEAVVEAAGLGRFDVVGDHDGAHLAAAFAVRHPKRVRRMALLRLYRDATVVYDPPAMRQLAEMIGTSWQLARLTMATWALRDGPPEMVPWMIDMMARVMSPEIARQYVLRLPNDAIEDMLRAVTVPTLVVQWRDDQHVGVDEPRAAAALIRGARVVMIDSPDPPWMGGGVFADAILNFLNEGEDAGRPGGLTPRELEILALVACGRSNQEIANELSISSRTAERHIGNIYLKIGAHNRAEATAYAYRNGMVPPAQAGSA